MRLLAIKQRKALVKPRTAKILIDARISRQAALDRSATTTNKPILTSTPTPVHVVLNTAASLPKPSQTHAPPPEVAGDIINGGGLALARQKAQAVPVKRNLQQPRLVLKTLDSMGSIVRGIMPQQPLTVTVRRRLLQRRRRVKFKIDASKYGGFNDLEAALGVNQPQKEAAIFIAIDTESERHGDTVSVVEVGITILDTRDIAGMPPGKHVSNWAQTMRHHHLVLDTTRKPRTRMKDNAHLFGSSQFVSTDQARGLVRSILRDSIEQTEHPQNAEPGATETGSDKASPRVILVGQSLHGDIATIRAPPLNINICDPSDIGFTVSTIFDTLALTEAVKIALKTVPSAPTIPARLGPLVAHLGVDPKYLMRGVRNVVGTHNAGNDAAYTMTALLLYAVRWREITAGAELPVHLPDQQKGHEPERKSGGRLFRDMARGFLALRVTAGLYVTPEAQEDGSWTSSAH